jgi:anti-sigma regulatory factor (Ser/Thr protein kinase)
MTAVADRAGYRHEAVLYAGHDEFLATTLPFVRDGIAAGEPVLVVTGEEQLDLIRAEFDPGDAVRLADMGQIGRNPGRIIALWGEFVREHDGQAVRGIGEPIHQDRTSAELRECQLHEELLNVAFAVDTPLWLMCPYDVDTLPGHVIEEVGHSHPHVARGDLRRQLREFHEIDPEVVFDRPLPPPPGGTVALDVNLASLGNLRAYVSMYAVRAGLAEDRAADLVLAVNEITTNSLRHGGGSGSLRVWTDEHRVVCEVADGGHITDPLIGRFPPEADATNGRGLWIANQLCDLVQIRSSAAGTTVRLHLAR